jgi:hypothetical protein
MQFFSDDSVVSYVEASLREVLPADWTVRREKSYPLCWQVYPKPTMTAASVEYYRLRVSSDRRLFVIEHDNSDSGGLSLPHVLLNAKILDVDAMEQFPLSMAILHVIRTCGPNEYGWT